MMLYASPGRDERKWENPDTLDITRGPADHLTFGFGRHNCAGSSLARLEGHAILSALAEEVARFEVGQPERRLNQVVRGLFALPTTITASGVS